MKIPFYSVIGPHLKRNYYFLRQFCSHPFLCISDFYTIILGLLGVVKLASLELQITKQFSFTF
jgi:hypothetical protein